MAAASSPIPSRRDLVMLPARRLLAVDAGSHSLKVLVVEEMFGRVRVLRREVFPLRRDEAAPASGETLARVQQAIRSLGDNPVAVALPHYRALSQVVDLPASDPADVRRAIEGETRKLSGLGESQLVYDYSPLAAFGRSENPFWVTLCQEGEVQRQLERCGVGHLDLCEVTTTANALVASFLNLRPEGGPAALVDFGASGTVVALVLNNQPVYSATFALGGDAFTEALAARRQCSLAEAEEAKTRAQALTGPDAAALQTLLQRWEGELRRVVQEWLQEHPDLGLKLPDFQWHLCGGGSEMPGLRERVGAADGLVFLPWPEGEEADAPPSRFAGAYGAALHALDRVKQPASLLPDEVQLYWDRNHTLQVVHSFLFFLLVILMFALGFATWQKLGLVLDKRQARDEAATALERAVATANLSQRSAREYESVRPILLRQKDTADTLQTLALLQQARSNRPLWMVLFSDAQTYLRAQPYPTTNPPPALVTNAPLREPGPARAFVAELCVPEAAEVRRKLVNEVVAELRLAALFSNVDSLPDDRRRPLADPGVLVPEGHVALELDLAENPFARSESLPERRLTGTAALDGRTGPRAAIASPLGERRTNALSNTKTN